MVDVKIDVKSQESMNPDGDITMDQTATDGGVADHADESGDVRMTTPRGSAAETGAAEGDDPVVQEIDIYLNHLHDPPDFTGDLYLLQYPLRPAYRPYGDQGQLIKAELRQKARHLQLTHLLDTSANNYATGGEARTQIKEHVLKSCVVSNPGCSYAVGVIHEGKMVLTPIAAVNQMRPDFSHMNKVDVKQQEDADEYEDDLMGDTKTVRVEFLSKPSDQRPSVLDQAQKEEDEQWISLDLYESTSLESKDVYEKHFVWPAVIAAEQDLQTEDPSEEKQDLDVKLQPIELNGEASEYLGRICGQAAASSSAKRKPKPDAAADGPSAHVLSRLPLDRQCEAILRHYRVVSFKQLKARLPQSTLKQNRNSDEKLFEALEKCGVLVQGNFILQSELAGYQGRSAIFRDLLLKIWTKEDILTPERVQQSQQKISLAGPIVKDIIIGIAAATPKGFKLKAPKDTEFPARFPQQAQKWDAWWARRIAAMQEKWKSMDKSAAGEEKVAGSKRPRAQIIGDIRSALAHQAMSSRDLQRRLQRQDPSNPIKEEEVLRILEAEDLEIMNVRGIWMQTHSQKEEHNKFRMCAINLFRNVDTTTKDQILEEYQSKYGAACELSEVVMRSLLKEFSERQINEDGTQAFVFKGAGKNVLR